MAKKYSRPSAQYRYEHYDPRFASMLSAATAAGVVSRGE